jgi:hypothetical protein
LRSRQSSKAFQPSTPSARTRFQSPLPAASRAARSACHILLAGDRSPIWAIACWRAASLEVGAGPKVSISHCASDLPATMAVASSITCTRGGCMRQPQV